ncbi:MAG: hypothetical protein J5379_03730 [Clostridiales bacterium]|nr:hypothetical protein [Clostridiales bacterium]
MSESDRRKVKMGFFDFLNKGKEKAAAQAEAAAKLAQMAPVGATGIAFGSQFSCANVFSIAPKPLDVGVKRSKELANRLVVNGSVKGGEFSKGDGVAIVGQDGAVKAVTTLLDVIKDDGANDFNTLLGANMGKKRMELGNSGWMIVDLTDGVAAGDIIAKL